MNECDERSSFVRSFARLFIHCSSHSLTHSQTLSPGQRASERAASVVFVGLSVRPSLCRCGRCVVVSLSVRRCVVVCCVLCVVCCVLAYRDIFCGWWWCGGGGVVLRCCETLFVVLSDFVVSSCRLCSSSLFCVRLRSSAQLLSSLFFVLRAS